MSWELARCIFCLDETETGYIKNILFDAINMFRCDYTDCKPKGNRQEVIMNTMNSAAALSSTKEDSLKKLVFAGIFAAPLPVIK